MFTTTGFFNVYWTSVFLVKESKALGVNRRLLTMLGSSAAVGSLQETKLITIMRNKPPLNLPLENRGRDFN
jgi:hypothetical protein